MSASQTNSRSPRCLVRVHRANSRLIDRASRRRVIGEFRQGRQAGADRHDGRPEPIVTKISQETLAEMVGTTRPRISFFMNEFRKLGFIE